MGGRTRAGCPLIACHVRFSVGASDALDGFVAVGGPVELEHEPAAIGVAQLFCDDPRLKLQLVEHVAGTEVANLVEIKLVLLVGGDALAQMVCRAQAPREGAPDWVPRSPLGFLPELLAALRTEDEVVAEPSWLVPHGALGGFGDVDRAGAVVLRFCLTPQRRVELPTQVVDVAIEEAVARGED